MRAKFAATLAGALVACALLAQDLPPTTDAPQTQAPALQSQAAGARVPQIRRHLERTTRPSSFTLISEALALGQISAETALLYRVFATFGDERLPLAFHGDDSALMESPVDLAAVRAVLPTFSAEAQAALRPFLVPPIYEGSWMAPGTSAPSARRLDTPPMCGRQATGWEWVQTSNGKVRIWWLGLQPDAGQADAAHATEMASWIDNDIWPRLVEVMQEGHQPVSDLSQAPCNGGNGLLDVYLTDVPHCVADPYLACGPSPVYVLVARNTGRQTLAHEIMHAFQYSYKLAGGCLSDNEKYRWWGEATAQWAMDYVYPSRQGEQDAAPAFLKYPEVALNTFNEYHEYGAYLLPFYIHRSTGNPFTIGLSWATCEASDVPDALHAIDAVVDGGFDRLWPEFVLHNWNGAPVDDYQHWDSLAYHASTYDGSVYNPPQVAPDLELSFPVDLPRLSATYAHYKFTTDDARSVAFWNGATFQLDKRDLGEGVRYTGDSLSAEEGKGGFVRALVKVEGKPWSIENWTERPWVTFCRDMADERLEELVLIVSNSDFQDYGRHLKAKTLPPTVWVSNLGCWQWTGTVEATSLVSPLSDFVEHIQTEVTWKRDPVFSGLAVHYTLGEGAASWWVTGGDCTGSGSYTLDGGSDNSFWTENHTPRENGLYYRAILGGGYCFRDVSMTCSGYQFDHQLGNWFEAPDPGSGQGTSRVKPDGTVDATFTDTNGGRTYTIKLTPQRQP